MNYGDVLITSGSNDLQSNDLQGALDDITAGSDFDVDKDTGTPTLRFRWAHKECYPGDEPEKVLQQLFNMNNGKREWIEVPTFAGVI